jgi:hypothetical protein
MWEKESIVKMTQEQNIRQANEIAKLRCKCEELELANRVLSACKSSATQSLSLEQVAVAVLTGLMANPNYNGTLREYAECAFNAAAKFIEVRNSFPNP